MTHTYPKLDLYLFPGNSGCIFDPATGVSGESSCPEGSEYIWQREIGSKNAWLWAAFDQSFSYSGGLIESCP